jgi:peptide/nickel transport system ATP-binding protein/oligopeptide transport system ATP-binding protein
MTAPLLVASGLSKQYFVGRTRVVALRGVDLTLERNEVLAVVGESGSGKSTLGHLLLGIERPSSGSIALDGEVLPVRRTRAQRRRLQLVQQNPLSALNPKRTVFQSVALPLGIHRIEPRARRRRRVGELLEMVGLSAAILDRHPHVLSGGQRQRVALARAIAGGPDALVLDEPTSALDVSVQAMVLELLADLQQRLSLSYLFITHDLAVVRVLAQRVVVLYRGQVVETGPTQAVFGAPLHRFTQMLISALPVVSRDEELLKPPWPWDREIGVGSTAPQSGCPFRHRCPYAIGVCAEAEPALVPLRPGHAARCHNPGP